MDPRTFRRNGPGLAECESETAWRRLWGDRRGVGVSVGFRRCVRWERVCCEILLACPLVRRLLLLRGW
jgi:hypothetical protein